MDLLASLPLDIVLLIGRAGNAIDWGNEIINGIRWLRILKLFRLHTYSKPFDAGLSKFKSTQEEYKMVIRVFGYYVLCHHLYGCAWVFFHRQLGGHRNVADLSWFEGNM